MIISTAKQSSSEQITKVIFHAYDHFNCKAVIIRAEQALMMTALLLRFVRVMGLFLYCWLHADQA
jgi:hypothetical protein